MAKRKSTLPLKKKRIARKKPIIYRDSRGRFITQKEYARLHKPVKRKPAIKKSVTTSKTPKIKIQLKIKPTVTVVKRKKKKVAVKKKPVVVKKRRITKPPIVIRKREKKLPEPIIVKKKKKKAKKRKKKIIVKPVIVEEPEISEWEEELLLDEEEARQQIKEKFRGFEEPVRGQLGMYNVSGIRGNTKKQLAAMINDQISRGAKRFRFWYSVPATPAYPQGIASTIIKSWQEVSTRYKGGTESWLKKLGGKVFFYWYVIA